MNYVECVCDNGSMNDGFIGIERKREMMADITSSMRNVGLLHFHITIALIPCFYNYMRGLPHQPFIGIQ